MSTVLLILAAICFGISAFVVDNVKGVKLIPLGLLFWVVAVLI